MDENIDEFKKELKKRKLKEKIDQAKAFVEDHPTESLAAATAAIGAVVGLIKRGDRKADIRKMEKLKELYIYDRSIGGYWKVRRRLTTSDMLEIERQKKLGRSLGEILQDMRLL